MADTKISALTSATIPLAGTEVLPVVQSGVTKQVSVADLTAGRAVSASSLTLTGSPLATGSGGTGLTSFTSNGIVYASSTSALTTGSGFAYNGTTRVLLLSNSSATLAHYSVGRTAAETRMGVVAATNDFLTGTAAGDGVLYALSGNAWYGTATNYSCIFTTNNTERAKIDTSGNYVPKAANTGINFTANTGAAGKTSQLLNWYEEGTWTPTDASGGSLSFTGTSGNCYYTRVGNLVTCVFSVTYPTTADVNSARITGLPFTSKSTTNAVAGGQLSYTNYGSFLSMLIDTGGNSFYFWTAAGALVTNATCSGKVFRGVVTYMI